MVQPDIEAAVAPTMVETRQIESIEVGIQPVKQLAAKIDAAGSRQNEAAEEVEVALRKALDDVRSAGHEVAAGMVDTARREARLGKDVSIDERIRRVLLREVAVQNAIQEATDSDPARRNELNGWIKRGEARLAAGSTAVIDYDAMFANALRAVNSDKLVYVVFVSAYKRVGLDLLLSLSSIGESFEMTVDRETVVAHVQFLVQHGRLEKKSAGLGKTVEVKLVGPAGTLLSPQKRIGSALDYEDDKVECDEENAVFLPLSVLTGEAWRSLGLPGQTRWTLLRENEFGELFGMSKDAFGRLPDWKQIPLKKKHGLF